MWLIFDDFNLFTLDKNLSNYKLFTLIPKLETPQSIALKEQSAELRGTLVHEVTKSQN